MPIVMTGVDLGPVDGGSDTSTTHPGGDVRRDERARRRISPRASGWNLLTEEVVPRAYTTSSIALMELESNTIEGASTGADIPQREPSRLALALGGAAGQLRQLDHAFPHGDLARETQKSAGPAFRRGPHSPRRTRKLTSLSTSHPAVVPGLRRRGASLARAGPRPNTGAASPFRPTQSPAHICGE